MRNNLKKIVISVKDSPRVTISLAAVPCGAWVEPSSLSTLPVAPPGQLYTTSFHQALVYATTLSQVTVCKERAHKHGRHGSSGTAIMGWCSPESRMPPA